MNDPDRRAVNVARTERGPDPDRTWSATAAVADPTTPDDEE